MMSDKIDRQGDKKSDTHRVSRQQTETGIPKGPDPREVAKEQQRAEKRNKKRD